MSAPTIARWGNPSGVASLVFGALLLATSSVWMLLTYVAPELAFSDWATELTIWIFVGSAVLGTSLGAVGLFASGRARIAAVFGIVIGAAHLLMGAAGLVHVGLFFSGLD